MGGNKHAAVITDRDRALLESLTMFRLIDREQARAIAGFKSIGRVNRRLLKLVRAGMLKRFFMPTKAGGVGALYTLTPQAIRLLGADVRPIQRGSDALLTTDFFAVHQLATNSVLLRAKHALGDGVATRLLTFRSVLSKSVPLLPDGYFELSTQAALYPMFLEVDLGSESLKIIEKKSLLYISLATSGEYERLFKHLRFRVLVVTSSERRLESFRKVISKHTTRIFWFSTLNAINSDGLLAPIWLRPVGDEKQSLL